MMDSNSYFTLIDKKYRLRRKTLVEESINCREGQGRRLGRGQQAAGVLIPSKLAVAWLFESASRRYVLRTALLFIRWRLS